MRCGSAVNGLALVAAFAAGLPLAATSAAQPGPKPAAPPCARYLSPAPQRS